MKFILLSIIVLCVFVIQFTHLKAQDYTPHANPLSVEMTRRISKELLGPNSGPYMQPLVTTTNAAANSRFFRTAFVPKKVDKPYFRLGVHSMFGFVRDDQKTYTPIAPRMTLEQVLSDTSSYVINIFTQTVRIKDTAGFVVNVLKYLIDKGLGVDSATSGLKFPKLAATIFGNSNDVFYLNSNNDTNNYFINQLTKDDPILSAVFNGSTLSKSVKDTLLNAIRKFPVSFPLPTGGNINTVLAAIPQLEIGSLYGTELLLRFIPPLKIDKNVGDFMFWGIGVKHSISQYFDGRPFDAALQIVYQGTHLENNIGVTNAELISDATIFDINLQASKSFEGICDVFGGISYETISIASSYKFLLPVETQMQLGLLQWKPPGTPLIPEPPEWPGDQKPQSIAYNLSDSNIKVLLGVAKQIGPITLFVDYSISKFNIFSGGIDFTF